MKTHIVLDLRSVSFRSLVSLRQALGAQLLVLLATMLFAPTQALSQVLVDNIRDSSHLVSFTRDVAQGFRTGGHSDGYTVTSVEMPILLYPGGRTPVYTAGIWSASSGRPNTRLGTLTVPDSIVDGVNTFTASGIDLAAHTTYFVVVDVTTVGTEQAWRTTSSQAENNRKAPGWTISDSAHVRAADDSGGWSVKVNPGLMRISGVARNATNIPPVSGNPKLTTREDTEYTYALRQFPLYDADAGDTLDSVRIVTLPASDKGTLTLNGANVSANDTVTTAQLRDGHLKYIPPANAHGRNYASFTFKVSDGTDESATYTVTMSITPMNDPATGAPTISGTAQIGQTLTAVTTGIVDVDGLTSPTYGYQWIRVDADGTSNPTDIAGAASGTYTQVRADVGKKLRVKVSFTDDDGNDEELTSAAFPTSGTVAAAPTVTDVDATSMPASGDTYGTGEMIRFTVTFDQAVTVTGTPEFEFCLGSSSTMSCSAGTPPPALRSAAYVSGSGTTMLVFSYTVVDGDVDDNGIWAGNQDLTIKLDGADAIQGTVSGLDAVLTHAEVGPKRSHKVQAFDPTAGICDRTLQVRDALVAEISGVSDCADVTNTHLAAITGWLRVDDKGITALKAGDFAGLTNVTNLWLSNNALTTLPDGVFAGLTSLAELSLNDNELTTLRDGVFDELTTLYILGLANNRLATLPDGVFAGLATLRQLVLAGNPGAPFAPVAMALPDDGYIPTAGSGMELDGSGSDGGPWGANVTYGWALTDPASGVTVTFDDAMSATTEVTIPALAEGAELTFTLTVTGRGTDGNGFVPATDTATATATDAGICARTRQVRNSLLDLIPSVSRCAHVTANHLAAITGTLYLNSRGLTVLAAGDFAGLTGLRRLFLSHNRLTHLPDRVFEDLTSLTTLDLYGNTWAPYDPDSVALPDDGTIHLTGGTVTLDGSGSGGAWGTNVTYGWALRAPASGVTVTFDDATSATTEVTIPALAEGTELTFSLSVTGRGEGAGVRPGGDTATVIVVDAGICGRTPQVRDALVAEIPGVSDCAHVTAAHLAAITGVQFLATEHITALTARDFAGLTSLKNLSLDGNDLATLPAGVFAGLTALSSLSIDYNDLTTLRADVFDGLTTLSHLSLTGNDLTTLPDDVFDGLTALEDLYLNENDLATLRADVFHGLTTLRDLSLDGNDLTTLPDDVFDGLIALEDLVLERNPGAPFAPEAVALPDDGTIYLTGGTVTLDGSGSGGAWGANVTYGWALTDPASGVTVTFDDAASAKTEVTIPALAGAAELTFSLSVTGRGEGAGVRPGGDTATVIVVAGICDRTPEVRDALVALIPGVSNCADVTAAHLAAITGTLELFGQQITALAVGDFAGLTSLTHLSLYDNALTTLPTGVFAELTSLTELSLYSNALTTLPDDVFAELTALTELKLGSNRLSTLPDGVFDGLTRLETLALHNNALTMLDAGVFDGLTSLTSLNLHGTRLVTLSDDVFNGLTSLTVLYLNNNELTTLGDGVFDGLTSLTQLYLNNTGRR